MTGLGDAVDGAKECKSSQCVALLEAATQSKYGVLEPANEPDEDGAELRNTVEGESMRNIDLFTKFTIFQYFSMEIHDFHYFFHGNPPSCSKRPHRASTGS